MPDEMILSHRTMPPGVPSRVVTRPRLDRLYDSLYRQHQHVAVIAPAGAGKTVQAQLFARFTELPLAWLSLRPADTSPSRLLASIAAALGPFGPGTRQELQSALRSDFTAEEAAAILAGMVSSQPFLLVLDQCEAVLGSPQTAEAAMVLSTFAEYTPPSMLLMSLSRAEFGGVMRLGVFEDAIGVITGDDLRLTAEEATEVIIAHGGDATRTPQLLEATSGWVAGVVFASRQPSLGQDSVDLTGYIQTEVLGRLPADEQQFLLDSSVLEVVTDETAAAIRHRDGRRLYERIRTRRLPATTMTPDAMVYHSVLKTVLRAELVARDAGREEVLLRRYAEHLVAHHHVEEATELLFELPDLDRAAETTLEAVPLLYRRSDWGVLSRWLDLLGPERVARNPLLGAAKIRALYGLRQFDQVTELIRRLDHQGQLRASTEADPGLVATMGWALQADPTEARRILECHPGDYRADAVRFMLDTATSLSAATPPQMSDFGEFDRLVSWSLLLQGRLNEVTRMFPAADAPVMDPNLALAPLWQGDITLARTLWERVPHEVRERPHSLFIEACILLAEDDRDSALSALQAAIGESRKTGFPMDQRYEVMLAFVLLAINHDDDAIAILEQYLARLAQVGQLALAEWGQTFLGVGYLRAGRPKEAQFILTECVRSMAQAKRRLLLPLASYCLAEAEAEEGNAEAAHEHAVLASHIASVTESTYWLGWGIRLFPTLHQRELAGDSVDQRWSGVAATDGPPRIERVTELAAPILIYLQPFGRNPDIFVDGEPKRLGRLKMLELVGFLTLHPQGVDRSTLQQQLFPESDQRRGGNHFRQITHKLRVATGVSLARFGGKVIWPSNVTVDSADLQFEQLLKPAVPPDSSSRIDQLRRAVELGGPYLERSDLSWADERRYQLDVLREEALLELANLSIGQADFDTVRELCESILEIDPYNESSYRLLIEAERQLGSPTSCLAVYRRAVRALQELGLVPSEQTVELVKRSLAATSASDDQVAAVRC